METQAHPLAMTGPETILRLDRRPSMPPIFFKVLWRALWRGKKPAEPVQRGRVVLADLRPDHDQIRAYKTVCGFSGQSDQVPASYIQTLFIGLLGKTITAPFFPIDPMGLIHTGQTLEQIRPVALDRALDLSCAIADFTPIPTGIQTRFLLEAFQGGQLVWQGRSTFLTRYRIRSKKKPPPAPERFLPVKETIVVPSATGRRYAAVSGDYNPHHLTVPTARLIGFKRPIAHGMWSLGRVMGSLEQAFDLSGPFRVDAAFKLPVFMPARITLGHEQTPDGQIRFELRDCDTRRPHLKGEIN